MAEPKPAQQQKVFLQSNDNVLLEVGMYQATPA